MSPSNGTRWLQPPLIDTYLETAAAAHQLLSDDRVAQSWERPSCLPRMRVAGLAGHLARSITLTEPFLDSPVADGDAIDAAAYYLAGDHDGLDTHANRRIRETGEAAAADGPIAVRDAVGDALARLRVRLPVEDLAQWFGRSTSLATVLEARVLELVVHCDDLASSVGAPTPHLRRDALDVTIATLLEMARRRHSDLAVVRALCRRERDEVEALRVL